MRKVVSKTEAALMKEAKQPLALSAMKANL